MREPEALEITVVTRTAGQVICRNCGCHGFTVSRHRLRCGVCGSRRQKRVHAYQLCRRVLVDKAWWPLKTTVIDDVTHARLLRGHNVSPEPHVGG